ncbi:MAG: phosphatidylglycerol lysyltransferase domain-containing protein [Bacteroides sp.]|nr:phosphatidylglycerol lysyltransferase domain-containing protein [Bacteroides sp.]
MITFKDITLEDRERITQYTLNSTRRNCDLSFSNLCSWRFLYNTQFAEFEGFLLLKFWSNNRLSYMLPVGKGDLKKAIEALIDDAEQENDHLRMLGVCPDMREDIEAVMPGHFSYRANRDYADYLYLRTDLATLTGKKYQSKRNHINKFRKTYQYEYLTITPELIPECIRLEAEWCRQNNCNEEDGTSYEGRAISYALKNFEALGLTGGILHVDGKIVAFTYGMPINQDTFVVHVEKADINIEGAYTMINYEFVNRIPEQFTYINREEDLGIEGLRKAKLSYKPVRLLEKSMAAFNKE